MMVYRSKIMKETMSALRETMKRIFDDLTPSQKNVFHRMYNYDGKHDHDVDGVSDDQLDWAFSQIESSLKTKEKI